MVWWGCTCNGWGKPRKEPPPGGSGPGQLAAPRAESRAESRMGQAGQNGQGRWGRASGAGTLGERAVQKQKRGQAEAADPRPKAHEEVPCPLGVTPWAASDPLLLHKVHLLTRALPEWSRASVPLG